jgi:hypothetical protein
MTEDNKSNVAEGERKQQDAQKVPEDLKRMNEGGEQSRPEDDVAPDPSDKPDSGR